MLGTASISRLRESDKGDIAVVTDTNLSFKLHMNDRIKEVYSATGIIRCTFDFFDDSTFFTKPL